MPSNETLDFDALAQTTNIEDMAEDELNRGTLRLLKNNDARLSHLRLWGAQEDPEECGDYHPGSSEELGWLGHFAKKSTHLHQFSLGGSDVFINCTEQSVDGFLEDLGNCNHITKMTFDDIDLTKIAYKLGPVTSSKEISRFIADRCYMGALEANSLLNVFGDMTTLEELSISYDHYDVGDDSGNDLDDDIMARCIPSLAACTCMRTGPEGYAHER